MLTSSKTCWYIFHIKPIISLMIMATWMIEKEQEIKSGAKPWGNQCKPLTEVPYDQKANNPHYWHHTQTWQQMVSSLALFSLLYLSLPLQQPHPNICPTLLSFTFSWGLLTKAKPKLSWLESRNHHSLQQALSIRSYPCSLHEKRYCLNIIHHGQKL